VQYLIGGCPIANSSSTRQCRSSPEHTNRAIRPMWRTERQSWLRVRTPPTLNRGHQWMLSGRSATLHILAEPGIAAVNAPRVTRKVQRGFDRALYRRRNRIDTNRWLFSASGSTLLPRPSSYGSTRCRCVSVNPYRPTLASPLHQNGSSSESEYVDTLVATRSHHVARGGRHFAVTEAI
jgi:hypothetical protein